MHERIISYHIWRWNGQPSQSRQWCLQRRPSLCRHQQKKQKKKDVLKWILFSYSGLYKGIDTEHRIVCSIFKYAEYYIFLQKFCSRACNVYFQNSLAYCSLFFKNRIKGPINRILQKVRFCKGMQGIRGATNFRKTNTCHTVINTHMLKRQCGYLPTSERLYLNCQ